MIQENKSKDQLVSGERAVVTPKRLWKLKNEKFLTRELFVGMSENMHYEIFKYMNGGELLEIRRINLGGYQLTSTKLLRSRIKNYYIRNPKLMINTLINAGARRIEAVYEQMEGCEINLNCMNIDWEKCIRVIQILRDIHKLKGINLCIIYYLYLGNNLFFSIIAYNDIEDRIVILAKHLYKVPNLQKLNLSNISIYIYI